MTSQHGTQNVKTHNRTTQKNKKITEFESGVIQCVRLWIYYFKNRNNIKMMVV
jgi:hypothetical protein